METAIPLRSRCQDDCIVWTFLTNHDWEHEVIAGVWRHTMFVDIAGTHPDAFPRSAKNIRSPALRCNEQPPPFPAPLRDTRLAMIAGGRGFAYL